MNMNDLASGHRLTRYAAVSRPKSQILQEFLFGGCEPPACSKAVGIVPRLSDDPFVGLAQLRGRFRKRVQHGLQIECRAADDLENVCGGGLLLQKFVALGNSVLKPLLELGNGP